MKAILLTFTLSSLVLVSTTGANEDPSPIPVISHRLDLGDDPENRYSGAPQLDWDFFGGRMRYFTKYLHNYEMSRHELGIEQVAYATEAHLSRGGPNPWLENVFNDKPLVPVVFYAKLGKIGRRAEDGERPHSYEAEEILEFIKPFPNVIPGGGQAAESDVEFTWNFRNYLGRLPEGPGGRHYPSVYFDYVNSLTERSGLPYLHMQHNHLWSTYYFASDRALTSGGPQLFFRANTSIPQKMIANRSSFRQYPHPLFVQFSGQPNIEVVSPENLGTEDFSSGYRYKEDRYGGHYGKSYALNRQALYYAWLNGAHSFNWETGTSVRYDGGVYPTPLGFFTKAAFDRMETIGDPGPVQTPIAVMSEFSNVWAAPELGLPSKKEIKFVIADGNHYKQGDYQLHSLHNFFMPHYLQCEWVYKDKMREDYAFPPTPYGDSVDYILSDIREEALIRYGLIIWGGIPPEAPLVVRDKLLGHIEGNNGRVILFAGAARRIFPEYFTGEDPELISAGSKIDFGGNVFTESEDFLLTPIKTTEGISVRGSVNNKPLIVEPRQGLVIVLSTYGLNDTPRLDASAAVYRENELITEADIPHGFLRHSQDLLKREIRDYQLFSVGNEALHYLVTRPRPGEFLIGLFNDRMDSQPFAIRSHIGKIVSIENIELNDKQDLLKSFENGIAYAPPAMRDPSFMPLDYGLSDNFHIEGRDFRLFRVKVKEAGLKEVPPIQFAERPTGRILSMPGLEFVRSTIQQMPSFFQWFEGIKVNLASLQQLEQEPIEEAAHWINRRGLKVVIDGTTAGTTESLEVLDKLSSIDSDQVCLLVGKAAGDLRSSEKTRSFTIIEASSVHRLINTGDVFNPAAQFNILDRYYRMENDLYHDLKSFSNKGTTRQLKGVLEPERLYPAMEVSGDVAGDFIYLGPGIHNLSQLLDRYSAELAPFAGIKIDSTYLRYNTPAQIEQDKVALDRLGLGLVVDLRRDIRHFDRIAFYPHIPNYSRGLAIFSEVIRKMERIGARDLILSIQDCAGMRNRATYAHQRDTTWMSFAREAEEAGVNLHLIVHGDLRLTNAADLTLPNVFVLNHRKGIPSPFRLLEQGSTIGSGKITIHDPVDGFKARGKSGLPDALNRR